MEECLKPIGCLEAISKLKMDSAKYTKLEVANCDFKFSTYFKITGNKNHDTSFILSFRAVRGISDVLSISIPEIPRTARNDSFTHHRSI